jgi:integrase
MAVREGALALQEQPESGDTMLGAWAARWMASRVDLKPKTQVGYASLLRTQILPAFGGRPISRIRPIDVQEWIARMQNAGLSPSRIRQAANLLGSILKAAVNEDMLTKNPCASARLPRMRQREMAFFTVEQVECIAATTRAPYDTLIHVLAYTGLRFGEAAALRRNDCELPRARLRVDESLAEVNGRLYFGAPKNHQHRYVVMPPFLVALLRRHLDQHVADHDRALVFTSPTGGPLRYGNFARRVWKPALDRAGIAPTGLHALRHTCASLLIAHGAPIKAVQAQLGHRSAELTLDRYGHLYPDQMDVLAARLEDARAAAVVANSPEKTT